MTDLETFQDLLNRGGWHRNNDGPDWRNDPDSYAVVPLDDIHRNEPCKQLGCNIRLSMSGQWTGWVEAHFAAGVIQHISLEGD